MKNKDIKWLDNKIQNIKKRKRSLKILIDPDLVKKIKKDLKREYRSVKRGEKNQLSKFIEQELKNKKNE